MKPRLFYHIALSVSLLTVNVTAQFPAPPKPPDTPMRPVTDEYLGVKVVDDYRWLENWDDPAVKQWSAAENARTREYLNHLITHKARLRVWCRATGICPRAAQR